MSARTSVWAHYALNKLTKNGIFVIAWMIVRAGLPVVAGSLLIAVVGILLGLFVGDYIDDYIFDSWNWVVTAGYEQTSRFMSAYHGSWMIDRYEVYGDQQNLLATFQYGEDFESRSGNVVIYPTEFAMNLSDIRRILMIPGHPVTVMIVYFIVEMGILIKLVRSSALRVKT